MANHQEPVHLLPRHLQEPDHAQNQNRMGSSSTPGTRTSRALKLSRSAWPWGGEQQVREGILVHVSTVPLVYFFVAVFRGNIGEPRPRFISKPFFSFPDISHQCHTTSSSYATTFFCGKVVGFRQTTCRLLLRARKDGLSAQCSSVRPWSCSRSFVQILV